MNTVRAFRLIRSGQDAEAWELGSCPLSSADVIAGSYVSWAPPDLHAPAHGVIRAVSHALRTPSGARPFRGFIVARRTSALVSFVHEHYAPEPGTALAPLLDGSLALLGDRIEALADEDTNWGAGRRQRRGRGKPLSHASLGVILGESQEPDGFSVKVTARGRWLVAVTGGPRAWVATEQLSVGPHRIPRERFVHLHDDDFGHAWFDGRRFGVSDSLDVLPPALRARLDKGGAPALLETRHGSPLGDLAPAFLLRVPTAAEVSRLGRTVGEPPTSARRAGFLLDSRAPVALEEADGAPRDVALIVDPAEALAVLARVGAGIGYVPHAQPADRRDVLLPAAGSWRIGAVPLAAR